MEIHVLDFLMWILGCAILGACLKENDLGGFVIITYTFIYAIVFWVFLDWVDVFDYFTIVL